MIKVTRLEQKGSQFEVILSNGDVIKANEEVILKYRLVEGKEFSEDILVEIYDDLNWYKAYQKALFYLSKGLKSTFKVKEYLKNKEFTDEEIQKVVSTLTNKGILNDMVYFKALKDYYIRQSYGRLYIKNKGIMEQIDSSIISEVLNSDEDYELYFNHAKKLYEKKKATLKAKIDFKEMQKIKKYLYSRGFDIEIINETVNEE